jgi:alcohol dehydrogenase
VLVLGARSTGLYATDAARALGAAEIVYADTNPTRLRLSRRLGAKPTTGIPHAELGEFDVIVDARLDAEWLKAALLLLAPEGTCESLGPYWEDTPFPLLAMYLRGASYRINRGNVGAHIPQLLELVKDGRLHPERVISETIAWEQAPEAIAEPSLKPMFVRDT